jgi:hypothetical protein
MEAGYTDKHASLLHRTFTWHREKVLRERSVVLIVVIIIIMKTLPGYYGDR